MIMPIGHTEVRILKRSEMKCQAFNFLDLLNDWSASQKMPGTFRKLETAQRISTKDGKISFAWFIKTRFDDILILPMENPYLKNPLEHTYLSNSGILKPSIRGVSYLRRCVVMARSIYSWLQGSFSCKPQVNKKSCITDEALRTWCSEIDLFNRGKGKMCVLRPWKVILESTNAITMLSAKQADEEQQSSGQRNLKNENLG